MRYEFARVVAWIGSLVGFVVYGVFLFAAWANWQATPGQSPTAYALLIGLFGTGTLLVTLMVDYLVFGRDNKELLVGLLAILVGIGYHGVAMSYVAHGAAGQYILVAGEVVYVAVLIGWRHRRRTSALS